MPLRGLPCSAVSVVRLLDSSCSRKSASWFASRTPSLLLSISNNLPVLDAGCGQGGVGSGGGGGRRVRASLQLRPRRAGGSPRLPGLVAVFFSLIRSPFLRRQVTSVLRTDDAFDSSPIITVSERNKASDASVSANKVLSSPVGHSRGTSR